MALLNDIGTQFNSLFKLPSQWLQTNQAQKQAQQMAALSAPKTTVAPQYPELPSSTTPQYVKPATGSISFGSTAPTTNNQIANPTSPTSNLSGGSSTSYPSGFTGASSGTSFNNSDVLKKLAELQNTATGLSSQVKSFTPPPPPVSSQNNYDADIKSWRERLMGYLTQSEEEKALQEQLRKQNESAELGVAQIENQPIAMPLITGQAEHLTKLAGIKSGSLSEQLKNLQAARLGQKDIAELGLTTAEKDRDFYGKQKEGFSLGEGQIRYEWNPQTGKYEQAGSGGIKSDAEKRSAAYQEYLDARKEGYTGTFSMYQNEDANRKARVAGVGSSGLLEAIIANPNLFNTLTPSIKAGLIPQLQAAGFNFPQKLSGTQAEDIATMDTVRDLANQVLSLGKNLPGVGAAGYGSLATGLASIGLGTAEGQHVRDLVGNIQGTIAKLRGGTSFTPNEQALLERYTPTVNDADWQIIQKITDLVSFINTKKENLVNVVGGVQQQQSSAVGGGEYQNYLRSIGQ